MAARRHDAADSNRARARARCVPLLISKVTLRSGGTSPEKAYILANLTPDGVFAEVDARLAQAARSITQSELHPSPPTVLLSSHASAVLRMPLPQMCTGGV